MKEGDWVEHIFPPEAKRFREGEVKRTDIGMRDGKREAYVKWNGGVWQWHYQDDLRIIPKPKAGKKKERK